VARLIPISNRSAFRGRTRARLRSETAPAAARLGDGLNPIGKKAASRMMRNSNRCETLEQGSADLLNMEILVRALISEYRVFSIF